MTYPSSLGATRGFGAHTTALIQMMDTAILLDRRVRADQRAFAGVTAADYEANGAPAGTGAFHAQLNADLAAFLGTPAWTKMMSYVDTLCDIGR